MSFKREGNDKSQLNVLKKRRVADLLSHFIPEDEAVLLKNGRYSCVVCCSRPVFDTVDMLTVHRRGKKHLEGLKGFYGKKSRLKNEITKRRQEEFVKAEEKQEEPSGSAPLLERTRRLTRHALLKSAPYNSCHRKTSTKSEKGAADSSWTPSGEVSRNTPCRDNEDPHKSTNSHATESHSSQEERRSPAVDEQEAAAPMTAQRKSELQRYVKLKSDGWLQDWSGRWVKDENVEFDSDEEEPPSLAPLPSSHSEDGKP